MKNLKHRTQLIATAVLAAASMNAFSQLACNDISRNLSSNSSVINCTGILYDSGGPGSNYGNNESNYIIINPIDATSITLTFSAFNTEASFDKVEIYNVVSGGTPLYTFSGTSVPSPVTISGDVMRIRFVTDGTVVSSGFAASWVATGGSCGSDYNMPASVISAKGKVFDSGGPGGNYGNNENKIFNIEPKNATSVCLSFYGDFNLELNYDFLKVYNNINGGGTLLGSFTGTTLPSNITSSTGKMSLVFTSDATVVYNGFKAIWTSDGDYPAFTHNPEARIISSQPTTETSGVSIFPNPSNSIVNIGFEIPQNGQSKIIVYNAAGMETTVLDESLSAGKHNIQFDASLLPEGVYFCKVILQDEVIVQKFIKN